jgi:hypothetical protein
MPAEWVDEDAYAVQAMMHGRASEAQQLRAMRFIVENICGTYDQSYRPPAIDPDGRAAAFAAGKRQVGLELVKFANLNIAQVRGKQTEQGETPKEQPT